MLFDIIFHPFANALPGRCPLPKSKLNCFPDLICQLVSWDLFSRMQMWVGVCKWSISHPMMAVLRKNAWSFMLRTLHVTSSAFLWQQSLNGQAIPKRYAPCFCWRIKLIEKGGFKLSWFKSSMDRVFSNQSSPIGLAQLVSHLAQLVSTTPKKILLEGLERWLQNSWSRCTAMGPQPSTRWAFGLEQHPAQVGPNQKESREERLGCFPNHPNKWSSKSPLERSSLCAQLEGTHHWFWQEASCREPKPQVTNARLTQISEGWYVLGPGFFWSGY